MAVVTTGHGMTGLWVAKANKHGATGLVELDEHEYPMRNKDKVQSGLWMGNVSTAEGEYMRIGQGVIEQGHLIQAKSMYQDAVKMWGSARRTGPGNREAPGTMEIEIDEQADTVQHPISDKFMNLISDKFMSPIRDKVMGMAAGLRFTLQ